MDIKECNQCNLIKPLTDFYFDKAKGHRKECKICRVATVREWRIANKDKCRKTERMWYHADADRARDASLRAKYGINLNQYNELSKSQKDVCAICSQPESTIDPHTSLPRVLAVDHCHETNRIRGLLCDRCNVGLGNFKDNPNLLDSAASYLRK